MIFYFSGTGNTEYAAKRIAQATSEEIVSIPTALRCGSYTYSLKEGEAVGFIIPTYFYGTPTIVADFIDSLELKGYDPQKNYCFMLCTCGGGSGSLRYDFGKRLRKRGVTMQAAYEVLFPDNYIIMFNLLPPTEKIPTILEQAEVKIDEVIEAIRSRQLNCPKWSLLRRLQTIFSYPFYRYGRSTAPFHITEQCTHCRLCAKSCPSGMIHMLGGVPVWDKGKCTQCLACIHRCPVRAIEYGKKTQKRGRYVNPHLK